jgi:hypothetical protein
MKRSFLTGFLSFSFSFFFLFLGLHSVSAQGSESARITLSPPVMELQVNAGVTFSREVTLKNRSNVNVQLSTSVSDFYYDANGEMKFIDEDEVASDAEVAKFSVRDWLTLSDEGVLDAFGKNEYTLTISVPEDASPGGHYGMVFFQPGLPDSEREEDGARILNTASVGMMLLLTVNGDDAPTGSVVGNTIETGMHDLEADAFEAVGVFTGSSFFKNGPVDFRFHSFNGSSTHFKPTGLFTVYNMFGTEVAEIPINSARIFPGTSRQMVTRWNKDFFVGKYQGVLTFADPSGANQTITFSFWGIPLYLTLSLLLVLVLGYYGVHAWAISMATGMKKRRK